MRRSRRSSFGSGDTSGTPGVFDQKRRTELLAEARRKRVAWVEEARGVDEGVDGARKRKEDEAAENGRKAESELERLFPSAVKFHDFLSGLAGDPEESPAGDLSAILQPFMLQDVDTRDDRPIPSYREGARPYDVFLNKLRHPRAAEVVKGLQQFVAAFKARSERRRVGVTALSSPGPRGISGRSSSFGSGQASGATSPRLGGRNWGAELPPAAGGVSARKSGYDGGEDGTPAAAAAAAATAATAVTAATMSGMMHAFLGRVETQMRGNVLWRRETEAQWEETRESLERIVMHKVFSEAYCLAEDPSRDEAISERLRSLSFLTEEHLGVPPLVDSKEGGPTWSDAEGQLLKMSHMRCPGDMLGCIIRCTRIVAGLLTGDQAGGVLPGADEFLPALILLVKRANPPRMHSSLEFVQSFRDPSKLLSEAGYVLTQVVSAVCFLEEVDASVLSIAHGDFERGLKGFQETAIVGLRAHQQEVRKEEEHERLLHSASQNQPNSAVGTSSPALSSSTTAVPQQEQEREQQHVDDATNGSVSANGGPPPMVPVLASRSPGPAALPQPNLPRQIGPAEVRAKRIAGTRAGQLLLAPTGGCSSGGSSSSSSSSGSGSGFGGGSGGGGIEDKHKQKQQGEKDEGAGGGGHGNATSVDSNNQQQQQGQQQQQQGRRRQGRQQQPQQHRQQQGRRRQVGPGPSQRLWELGESGLGMGMAMEIGVGVPSQLRFVGATAAELRMSELPELLAEHQKLARLCEELLAERAELGQRRRRM